MYVIDDVKLPGFSQWCPSFVEEVLSSTHLRFGGKKMDTVIIDDIDENRIFLSIHGFPFIIRTWSYTPCEQDSDGKTCAEMVEYTLFFAGTEYKSELGRISANGTPMYSDVRKIQWTNTPETKGTHGCFKKKKRRAV